MLRRGLSISRSVVRLSSEKAPAVQKVSTVDNQVTHTGQAFPEGDFRMNRYLGGKKKALSARWAIDMIAEEPVIMTTNRRHMCDGTYGGLNQAVGHPRVWINLDDGQVHECPYCGLRYQKVPAAGAQPISKTVEEEEEN
ncbi:Oidioi.mRNA.OKI2018_I69.XSR.g16589.t1.cds [Oikopleura dioica]|uniref:Oidioi.mRNA.OKI2018_I69.XSR.g16589.t1.cds n=1 Tax=Oikopleura dioica TaxID=34765 RepID=A0ABN7SGL0_OIKDI|nr:Oidioi.mRNA.OKI2018_I69.XSR.g16589.t1.cds [Oikopleura dioica]